LSGPQVRGLMREYGASPRGWSLADGVVAAGIFFAAALLFFPAVVNSRHHAQLALPEPPAPAGDRAGAV
jgi:hypothetical protein